MLVLLCSLSQIFAFISFQDLKNSYEFMRKSRPDGNCFFRAFGFSLFNSLLHDSAELDRMFNVANQVLKDLRSLGFTFTVEDFHEAFVSVLQDIKDGKVTNVDELLDQVFNDRSKSDYLVVFLRLVTSSHLQKNSDFFAAFIEDGLSVKEFCSSEVEPMFKESDHIHVIAITSATGVGVRINYLDRGGTAHKVNIHDFPEGVEKPRIHLLYRPGHYDVLYVKHESFVSEGESPEQLVPSSYEPESTPGIEGTSNSATATARSHSEVSSSSPGSPSSQGASSSKNPRLDSLLTGPEDSNEPSTTS